MGRTARRASGGDARVGVTGRHDRRLAVATSDRPKRRSGALIATDGERVVGFATTMPSQDDDADRGRDGAIDALVVDPVAQHQGHGSRLLNACADTLRADGFVGASCWVNADDETFRLFLIAAGWALDGATREIGPEDESVRLKELRLHTSLQPGSEIEDR